MKKYFIAFLLLIATSLAFAGLDSSAVVGAGFDKLSEQQKAEIIKKIADKRAEPQAESAVAVPSTQRVDEWLNIGTKIGMMFGGAAKEVGIAVNDFVKTPVGMWTMAIIVWKFMGGVIVHLVGGVVVLVVGMSMTLWLLRSRRGTVYTYDKDIKNMLGNHPLLKKEVGNLDDEWAIGGFFMMAVIIVSSLVVTFSY